MRRWALDQVPAMDVLDGLERRHQIAAIGASGQVRHHPGLVLDGHAPHEIRPITFTKVRHGVPTDAGKKREGEFIIAARRRGANGPVA